MMHPNTKITGKSYGVDWQIFDGVDTEADLLRLASSVGTPRRLLTGEVIKNLFPITSDKARPSTFASEHGLGRYPLHTDTAHYPVPVRFLVMRVIGRSDRPTNLVSVAKLLGSLSSGEKSLMRDAVWTSGSRGSRFTCTLLFRHLGASGFRYDPMCMVPANKAAKDCRSILSRIDSDFDPYQHFWTEGSALVISNWNTLHGRGIASNECETRILQRIYVD